MLCLVSRLEGDQKASRGYRKEYSRQAGKSAGDVSFNECKCCRSAAEMIRNESEPAGVENRTMSLKSFPKVYKELKNR